MQSSERKRGGFSALYEAMEERSAKKIDENRDSKSERHTESVRHSEIESHAKFERPSSKEGLNRSSESESHTDIERHSKNERHSKSDLLGVQSESHTDIERHSKNERPKKEILNIWSGIEVKDGYTIQPNSIVDDLYRYLSPAEQAVYTQLFRLSWGWGKPSCHINLPNLATRCNLGRTTTHKAIQDLISKGLVINEEGVLYSLPIPERLSESVRHARSERHSKSEPNKTKKLLKQTPTQRENSVGVGGSRFSVEQCRAYANHLHETKQGINNPGGYAMTIHRTGEADELIEKYLNQPKARDISECPDCEGRGMILVEGKGAVRCKHPQLT
jgi:hypothetical protein